jgi:hypothetical protein
MACPYLREVRVNFCQASPYKKMIIRLPEPAEGERGSSPDFQSCPAAKQCCEDRPSFSRCPSLQESLVQFCAAAAIAKYIPYSEFSRSRCGNGDHSRCEFYRAIAFPDGNRQPMETAAV